MRTAKRMGLRTDCGLFGCGRTRRMCARRTRRCGSAARRRASPTSNIAAIIDAAKRAGADAVHPGYGFLAENAEFAQAVVDAGLTWVGPPPAAIRQMGDKAEAKRIAREAGVPTIPGAEPKDQSNGGLSAAAKPLGFPLMIKAAAGGGGRGMRLVRSESELAAALDAARSEAEHAFGDGRLLLERALEGARHIEVQVFADQHGNVIHLGERDCSVQRRHQKLIEESPSPAVDAALREKMGAAAVALAKAVNYVGAGTIEFLLDATANFYFMEMNTRLQVEHPVTEAITGIDLVEWQLRVATRRALHAPAGRHPFSWPRHRGAALRRGSGAGLPAAGRADRAVAARRGRAHRPCALFRRGDFAVLRLDDRQGDRAWRDARSGARAACAERSTIQWRSGSRPTRPSSRRCCAMRNSRRAARRRISRRRLSSINAAEPDSATLAIAAALLAKKAGYGEWNSWSQSGSRDAGALRRERRGAPLFR